MREESYEGVPREKIQWGPTIDYNKCVSCGKCVEFCHQNVFEFEEKNGQKRPVVKRFNNCVVFCKGCDDICPAKAISHPNEEETQQAIDKQKEKSGA
jgi:NAD-dependent dihydropyrimidine dehydrogenase PreA subunit